MALNKVTYTDDVTVIEAENLNDIQDEIITNTSLFSAITKYKGRMGEDQNTSLDFNDYKTDGIYYNGGTNATGVLNPPHSADNGWLVVNTFSNSRVQQIWYGAYTGVIKTRHYNSGTNAWTAWYEVVTSKGGTFGGNIAVDRRDGTTSSVGESVVTLGNNISEGTANNSRGILQFYAKNGYYTNMYAVTNSANRSIQIPDASGAIAVEQTGTWSPQIYDYETLKYTWTNTGQYWRYGKIAIYYFSFFCTYAVTITQMLQIRGFPSGSVILGGNLYCATISGCLGDRTIQSSGVGVYVRPNFTGEAGANGTWTACFIVAFP